MFHQKFISVIDLWVAWRGLGGGRGASSSGIPRQSAPSTPPHHQMFSWEIISSLQLMVKTVGEGFGWVIESIYHHSTLITALP